MSGEHSSLVEGSPLFPEPDHALRESSSLELDRALDVLAASRAAWSAATFARRAGLVAQIRDDFRRVEEAWIELSLQAKRLERGSFGESEEWVFVAFVYRLLRILERTLREGARSGLPSLPGRPAVNPAGRTVVPVLPYEWHDRLTFRGIRGEVWMSDDVTPDDVLTRQGRRYLHPPPEGTTTLVLGAGNLGILAIGDVLNKVFVERTTVILKLNPVNAYLGPLIEAALTPIIDTGVCRVVYGGSEVGQHLVHHPLVDAVHVTGSDKTYEGIVFGVGPEAARRKQAGRLVMTKPFTAELGNVSPVIVVPGVWSGDDIDLYGARLASWLAYNAGFNCVTPRVLITHESWPQRQALLQSVRRNLDELPTRHAYYPGAFARQSAFLRAHPNAHVLSNAAGTEMNWTFAVGVDADAADDTAFRTEAFCTVMAETALAADDESEFLGSAVRFANEALWGTLAATIVVSDEELKRPHVEEGLGRAIRDLRYGAVAVNVFVGFGYGFGQVPVGPYPGSTASDIQSGVGVVHNYLLLDGAQKAVMRGPFRVLRDPMIASRANAGFGKKLARFERRPSVGNLLRVGWAAARSKVTIKA